MREGGDSMISVLTGKGERQTDIQEDRVRDKGRDGGRAFTHPGVPGTDPKTRDRKGTPSRGSIA